ANRATVGGARSEALSSPWSAGTGPRFPCTVTLTRSSESSCALGTLPTCSQSGVVPPHSKDDTPSGLPGRPAHLPPAGDVAVKARYRFSSIAPVIDHPTVTGLAESHRFGNLSRFQEKVSQ